MRSISLLAFLCVSTTAVGQGKVGKERTWADDARPPSFHHLQSASDNSALSMECQGEAPYTELECTFDQLSLRSPDPERLAKKLAEWREEALKDLREKPWPQTRAKLCQSIKRADLPPVGSPEAKAIASQDLATFKLICACDSAACAAEAMSPLVERQERTCHISHHRFEFSFKRVGLDRWVHTSTRGLCNYSFLVTLDRKGEYLWTYTERRLPGDIGGDAKKGDLCATEETTTVFTWEAGRDGMDLSKACAAGLFKFSVF